jgi:RNA polymerase sigma-B factor
MAPLTGSSAPADLLARRSARHRARREIDDRLFRLYAQSPSPGTREAIVVRYLGLANHVARQYAGGREPWDDLLQVASVALLHAIDRYDPDRGVAFSSFAIPTITGELKRHFRDRCWTVRPPRALMEVAPRIARMQDSLTAVLGRAPTLAEVATAVALDQETVSRALEARTLTAVESLSGPESGEDGAMLSWPCAEDGGYARAEARATLKPLLRTLSSREREIVRLRYVEDRTQVEIAEAIGVSQMHVSRLLRIAVRRMSTMARAA